MQDECWWDCIIISIPETAGPLGPFGGLVITNPECLKDCFAAYYTGRQRNGGVGKKAERRDRKEENMGVKYLILLIGLIQITTVWHS